MRLRSIDPTRQTGLQASGGDRDIVVIGASAGGGPALLELAQGLPQCLEVTIHSSPHSPGLRPLITRAGPLSASHAIPGESIERNTPDALWNRPSRGDLSPFTCSACGGTLWEAHDRLR